MNGQLVLGTNNPHKAEEIAPLLEGVALTLLPASHFGRFDPAETGRTPEANALIKAQAALALSGCWAIADDTALEVDALGGRPGIYAARYAGEGCSFEDNTKKLLRELQGVPGERRGARFLCAVALCRPEAPPQIFKASCAGSILTAPRGLNGFGYDPVFLVEGSNQTFAELTREQKNRLSHRARAVRMLKAELLNLLAQKEELKR